MNWTTYKQEAKRTFAIDQVILNCSNKIDATEFIMKLNQLHCVIGISTEIAEFADAIVKKDATNIKEEIGDIMWYTANLERLTDNDAPLPKDMKGVQVFADEWLFGTQELVDHYKKAVYYGSDVDQLYVKEHLRMIKETICGIVNNAGGDIESILETNINKLRIRYPEKFNQDEAENRDLVAERKELEK